MAGQKEIGPKTDPLNDLANGLVNAILIIRGASRQLGNSWKDFNERIRACPYAGREDSACKGLGGKNDKDRAQD